MELATITAAQILSMFIIMLVGMIGAKAKIITQDGARLLTNLLMMIVMPLLIFTSYQQDFSADKLVGLGIAAALALLSHAVAILFSHILIPGKRSKAQVERMAVIYTNCAFIGIPLVSSIFGAEGVFYVSAYITVFNLLIWTHGVVLMTGDLSQVHIKSVAKSPNILAIFFGLAFFLLRFRLPPIILDPVTMIASLNTPMAMLLVGATMVHGDLLGTLKNHRVYWITFLRLLLVPVVLLLIFKLLPLDDTILTTILIATACPAGATGTMFALRFGNDAQYASGLLAVSTLFSILTIPALVFLNGLF